MGWSDNERKDPCNWMLCVNVADKSSWRIMFASPRQFRRNLALSTFLLRLIQHSKILQWLSKQNFRNVEQLSRLPIKISFFIASVISGKKFIMSNMKWEIHRILDLQGYNMNTFKEVFASRVCIDGFNKLFLHNWV
jgi:hypothetical protein